MTPSWLRAFALCTTAGLAAGTPGGVTTVRRVAAAPRRCARIEGGRR
ncbi:hypothetical protein HDC37_000121 [Microbacterium sp. AK009]|nr:hypothetical protein [Microbacterium sp. AK009]